MKKKVFSILLILFLVISIFPGVGNVMADESQPGVVDTLYPYLNWEDAVCDSYTLYLSTNQDYSSPMIYTKIKNSEFYIPNKLSYNTVYYWKAIPVVNGAEQAVVKEISFKTLDVPSPVEIYNNNFENEAIGDAMPSQWEKFIGSSAPTNSQVTLESVNGNKVIKLNKIAGDTSPSPGVVLTFSPTAITGGILTMNYILYISANQNVIYSHLGNNNAGVIRTNKFANVAIVNGVTSNAGGTSKHFLDGAAGNQTQDVLVKNTWISYKVVANLDNKTYNYYINGVQKGKSNTGFKRPTQTINQFAVTSAANNRTDVYGEFLVDNVSITHQSTGFPKPAPVSPNSLNQSVSEKTYFQWVNVPATSYTLIIDEDPIFGSPERIISGITTNAYTLNESEKLDNMKRYYWKIIATNGTTSWADDTVPTFVTVNSVSDVENISLFEICQKTLNPGETVTLTGNKLQESEIEMYRLPDTDFSQIESIIGAHPRIKDLSVTDTLKRNISLVYKNDKIIDGIIPNHVDYGAYVFWAKDTSGRSNPVMTNKTEAYFVYPDVLNRAVEREVRIIGKNLTRGNGSSPSDAHVYLRNSQGVIYPVTAFKSVSQYDLKFDIPSSVPVGSYEVWVNNGHGGAYGWSNTLSISIIEQAPIQNTYNVLDFGATPDDATVDNTAIQAAIDAAAVTGGIVTVPDGRYIIDTRIVLKQGVTLLGNGIDSIGNWRSTIKYIDGATFDGISTGLGLEMIYIEGSNAGIKGLKLVGSVSNDRGVVLNSELHDIVIQNNYIDNWFYTSGNKNYYAGISGGDKSSRLLVDNNTFIGGNLFGVKGVSECKVSNNNFFGRRWTTISLTSSYKNIIENNRFDGRNEEGKRRANRAINFNQYGADTSGWGINEYNYISGNDMQYYGDEVVPTNDGELVNFDSNADRTRNLMFYGYVDSATDNTVTLNNANWPADLMKNLIALVVEGKGLGQYRRVVANDSRTLILEKDWDVKPDIYSKITVTGFYYKNISTDNTASNNKRGTYLLWADCLENTLDHNVVHGDGATEIVGIDFGRPTDYFPSYYNEVKNSIGQDGYIRYADYMSPGGNAIRDGRTSVNMLGNSIRSSTFEKIGFYTAKAQVTAPLVVGSIIENNTVTSSTYAINVLNFAKDTIVRNNQSNATPMLDDKGITTVFIDQALSNLVLMTAAENVNAGGDVDVKLKAKNVNNLKAVDATIEYDQDRFTFDNAYEIGDMRISAIDNQQAGKVRIVAAHVGQQPTPYEVDLFRLKFVAKQNKTGYGRISVSSMVYSDGNGMESTCENDYLSIYVSGNYRKQLTNLISVAQSVYVNKIEESYKVGKYPIGSRARLQAAIENARHVSDNSNATEEELNTALEILNRSIERIENSIFKMTSGDINGDGKFSIGDLAIVASKYAYNERNVDWKSVEHGDLNADGEINIDDLTVVAKRILDVFR